MSPGETSEDEAHRLVEASAWRVRLTALEADSTAEFEDWLAADSRNAEAWKRVEAPWDFLGAHAAEPQLLDARSAALRAGPRFGAPEPVRPVRWRAISAAALVALALLGAGLFWWLRPLDYQTALGERRTLMLSDGSRLTLDSNSEVRVSYSGRVRNLELVRGQARFQVAHESSRPFLVGAGGAAVRATGTDFDVDLPPEGMTVTLIEGHVVVSDGQNRTSLASGQQLTLASGQKPTLRSVDVADTLAWQAGQVVFHGVPLGAVISRLNRYDNLQIALADPQLAGLRVSGTFNTGDASRVAEILAQYLKVRAVYTQDGQIEFRR